MGDDKREQRKLSNCLERRIGVCTIFQTAGCSFQCLPPRVPSRFCTSHEMRFTALPRRKKEKKKEKSSNERSRWR